jgi:hypothetical protein
MALGAVTDDGDFLALDNGEVAIFVVINFHVLGSFESKGRVRSTATKTP